MVRTLITITDQDKKWLERYSRMNHQSMAKTIRDAINNFKQQNSEDLWKRALEKTAGIWPDKNVDAVKYVEKLRSEWKRDWEK